MEDYVHRVGRTGRAGKKGIAYSYFTKEAMHMSYDLIDVLINSGQEVPEELYAYEKQYASSSKICHFRRWDAKSTAESAKVH